jgi:hypothetical protein
MLKSPGTKRLKLLHDEPPSDFALKFNLRRYMKAFPEAVIVIEEYDKMGCPARGRGLHSSTFQLNLSRF